MEKIKTAWEQMTAVASLYDQPDPRDDSTFSEISGFDCHGRYFIEHTSMSVLKESHGSFCVQAHVARDSVVAVCGVRQNSQTIASRPELFEVVRVEPILNGWHIEASKLLPQSELSIRPFDRRKPKKQSL